MTSKTIPAREAFAAWRRDPAYRAEYEALDEEFALAETLIRARAAAQMTQEQVAEKMGTTQAAVARLESGRSLPSTRTLKRFAEATGTKLRIHLEPAGSTSGPAKMTPEPTVSSPRGT